MNNKSNFENLFEKKFCFLNNNYKLPPLNVLYTKQNYKVPQLQEIKTTLNDVKNKLNGYTREEWSAHTRKTNPAREIIFKVRFLFIYFSYLILNLF